MPDLPLYTRDPATGQTIIVYPDGTVVPVAIGGTPYVSLDQGGGAPGGLSPLSTPQSAERQSRLAPDPGYASPAPNYPSRTYDYSPRYPGESYDEQPTVPDFRNGARHPGFGGRALAPGGGAAGGGGDGAGPGRQVSVPGGATAGPFAIRSAPNQRGGYAHDEGGGGGSGASQTYWNLRNKFSNLGSGGSAYGNYNFGGYEEPKEPKEPRMRGPWAKGLDPDQAMGLAMRPSALLPEVMPGISSSSPLYSLMRDLPAYQLGILSKRNYQGTPSSMTNAIGNFYDDFGNTNIAPSANELLRNLHDPKRGGGLDDLFKGVRAKPGEYTAYGSTYAYGKEPLQMAEAANTYQSLLNAVLEFSLPGPTAAKYASYGDYLIDNASNQALKKDAGKTKPINRVVGRKLFR